MKPKATTLTKGLQKLTESQVLFNSLMLRDSIKGGGFQEATITVKHGVINLMADKLNTLKGVQLDSFIEKFSPLIFEDLKNQLWEKNHVAITQAISHHLSQYNSMPAKSQISEATGLSRQTVHKHMTEYSTHPAFIGQAEQFKFMGERVMSKVLESAINGDMKAARLYFDMLGQSERHVTPATLIKNQNNYIQINGTVLSQDIIKQLSPEQLNQIEGILNLSNSIDTYAEAKSPVIPIPGK